jgi:hypothetical protein
MIRAKSKPSVPNARKPKTSQPAASEPTATKARASKLKPAASRVSPRRAPSVAMPASAIATKAKGAARGASKIQAGASTASAKPALAGKASSKSSSASSAAAAASKAIPTPKPSSIKTGSVAAARKLALPKKSAAAKPIAAAAVRLDTPAKIRPIEQAVGVSSDAVARRTGKSWAQWFALLDAAGAAELDHKGIVAVLAQRHGVGPWWQQMVTVAYEQARGIREHQESDDGFQVDVSKILELPLARLFRFWAEPAERNKWLADDRFSIHKATASKSIRARWGRGVSRIDVDFCEKGPTKSQVTVQHNRIESSDAAEQMKAYWAKKIRALEALTRV